LSGSAQSAAQLFEKQFGYKPAGVWSAPGRVNLIGEHTDYNEGFVLPFAIDRRTYAAVGLRSDQLARIASSFAGEVIEFEISKISKGSVAGWSAYPLGVAWALMQAGATSKGFDLYVESNVPVGAGLSSSAAIECSVALALNDLWGAGLSKNVLAKVGQKAENEIVGAPTGIMDQTASLFGQADHAVFLDCRTLDAKATALSLEENGLEIWVMDTRVAHRLTDGGYAARRASCEKASELLGVSSLRDVTVESLEASKHLLDDVVYKRAKHVVTENERVQQTVKLLTESGPRSIGQLMIDSHSSMRDDFQISITELDVAVETALSEGAIGARMTGGGFGGAAIALIESQRAASLTKAGIEKSQQEGFEKPEIFKVIPDAGAKREI
jgi:galactokinase